MDKVVIARGIAMPFYPMRPANGRVLRNQGNVREFIKKELEAYDWVIQPKLEGDRACLGVLDKVVYIQNRHGGWYRHPVKNLDLFKRLPNSTVLDGEVYQGKFYPFDCLASNGKSHLMMTAAEREIHAFQLCKLLKLEWKFRKPSRNWVGQLKAHAPEYGGVVLKRMASPYIMLGGPHDVSLDWMKRCWG